MFGTGSGVDPPPTLPSSPVFESMPAAAGITLHVSGAVAAPGLVTVGEGARVADAVAAAGGSLPGADLGGINLAALVRDGDHIVVPVAASSGDGATLAAVREDGRVSLNTATVTELQGLPGVGPVLAQRIADHRDAHGPFRTVEDLLDVTGIGEAKLATLRDSVVLP
ncbi:MAG: ComEA family DNA-binding protein [Actinobacteria bacterium]|nr:ComEA family DNA-binding protein [Actinomycetota bacterium]NIU17914.1 ComEA family DNA-binding protein [Actinomycetota bacterium]NIU64456.1 ComEA family DNA-binding protein [Actinomycetota bacterium]